MVCDELKGLLRERIGLIDERSRQLDESRALLSDLLDAFETSTR